jgi:hypothetical protein
MFDIVLLQEKQLVVWFFYHHNDFSSSCADFSCGLKHFIIYFLEGILVMVVVLAF